jgi:type I restriction enzyme M protein
MAKEIPMDNPLNEMNALIAYGRENGLIEISDKNRIVYKCSKTHSERFTDPEEKVRAAYFVELVRDYQYPKDNIEIEVTVPRRTPEDRADIVVFEDSERKKPYVVVECKKDGISDSEFKQAIEQAFGNANSLRAKYAIVVAGNTRTAFDVAGFKPSERDKNVIADIPVRYGKVPQYRYIKGEPKKALKIVYKDDLIKTLEKAHATIWQGGKLAPTTAFDEMAKLLFCKLQDEKERTLTKKGEPYKFQIGTHESAQEIFDHVNGIYQYAKSKDSEVFKEDIKLEPPIVYNVIEHLQGINFTKTDLDTKGIAFERFMEDFFKGKMGQYFTPREIIKFCIEMFTPQENCLILDPACGSGGFLLNCLDYVRSLANKEYPDSPEDCYKMWHDFAKENLYGIEINDQIARVCKMNMIIHDDGHTNIISHDALDNVEAITKIHHSFKLGSFDFIFTNPPFGANVKSSEHEYLHKYTLGKGKKSQKTEILFVEKCIEFLKKGTGLLCMVLPDSILINKSLQYVRNFILEETQILAIVSLPDFTFSHYGANVKSSLLFARIKNDNEICGNYDIFLANAESVGYTAAGKFDVHNDFPVICNSFHTWMKNKRFVCSDDYKDKIYIASANELHGNRIDPRGYSPIFKELKRKLANNKHRIKRPLHELVITNLAGEWGKGLYDDDLDDDDVLCYVIRNTNFDNHFNLNLDDIALRYIPSGKAEELQLCENDILIEKSGGSPIQPVGRVALIKGLPNDKPVIFSNFLQMIHVDESVINPKYVYVYLRSLWSMGYMQFLQNQTTGIKNLLLDEFLNIEIPFFEKPEAQLALAERYLKTMEDVKTAIGKQYKQLEDSKTLTLNEFLA